MSQLFPVVIDLNGRVTTYSSEFQTDPSRTEQWKRVLLLAHGKAVVSCNCPGQGEKRLSVRHRSDRDAFFLARFPETGHQHHDECTYYAPDPMASGLSGYQRGVVEDLEDGGVRIRLKVGLQRREANDDAVERNVGPRAPGVKRPGKPAMTLLGLLHLMWTTAGFNRWSPRMAGKRDLWRLHKYLGAAGTRIQAGRTRVSQALLLATTGNGEQATRNAKRVEDAMKAKRRLIAIAPLAKYKENYEEQSFAAGEQCDQPQENITRQLPIMGFFGFPIITIESAYWVDTLNRFSNELIAWRQGERLMVIMQTDVPTKSKDGRKCAQVTDIALMRVTSDWIPVESSYEAQLSDTLVAAGRHFEKPLKFDAEDKVFPDFWLKDVEQVKYPMEVWGMSTPDYEVRKHEKIAHYETEYGPQNWWSWNAASGDPIPALTNPR